MLNVIYAQGEKKHKHGYIKVLKSLQHKTQKIILGTFLATSILALNIETFIFPISQNLKQIACKTAVQISCITASDHIKVNQLTKTRRNKILLKVLYLHIERKARIQFNKLEKIQPYIMILW